MTIRHAGSFGGSLGLVSRGMLLVGVLLWPAFAFAAEASEPIGRLPDSSSSTKSAPDKLTSEGLAAEQAKVRGRYKELESAILRMSEAMKATDPKRAAILRQAFAQSRESHVETQLETLTKLLEKDQLFDAKNSQAEVQKELARLLELLLSGDRSKQVQSEKARIRAYITRLNGLIKEQKGVQARTARDNPTADTAERQGDLADKTDELAKEIARNEEAQAPSDATQKPKTANPSEPYDGDPKPGEKSTDDTPGSEKPPGESNTGKPDKNKNPASDKPAGEKPDSKNPDSKKPDGKNSDAGDPSSQKPEGDKYSRDTPPADKPASDKPASDKPPGEKPSDEKSPGKPMSDEDSPPAQGQSKDKSAKPSKSSPMPGQPDESGDMDPDAEQQPPKDDRNQAPGRKRIAAAEEKMRQAQQKVEQAKKDDALKDQEKAIEELQLAKAELEEILRQLREEETERMLAMLETRFRKMLQMQIEVLDETVKLSQTAGEDREREQARAADVLSKREGVIAVEADRALTLLREEGSAVAMPEAVEQLRDDMEQVRDRLYRANVGEITQGIEREIIVGLEEMIAALQKAQKDQKKKKSPTSASEGGEPQDPPLVNKLAELKMIRALQMRVNTRHERYSKLVAGEQANDPEILDALGKLSERQQRLYRTARDIVSGKNQ